MKFKLPIALAWMGTVGLAFFMGFKVSESRPGSSEAASPGLIDSAPEKDSKQVTSLSEVSPVVESNPNSESQFLPLNELLFLEDSAERYYQISQRIEALDANTLPGFLSEVAQLPHSWRQERWMASIIQKWGEIDPEAAQEYIAGVSGTLRIEMVRSLAWGWAKTDPEKAWEYALNQSGGGSDFQMMRGPTLEILKTDPALAIRLLENISDQRIQNLLYRNLGDYVAMDSDFAEVYSAVNQMEDVNLRTTALNGLWSEWAKYDLEGAMTAYEGLEAGPENQQALERILSGWAAKDPREAIDYVMQELGESERPGALKEVVKVWAESGQITEASEFILELPVNQESDDAVNAILYEMSLQDPEIAMDWLNSIQNEERIKAGKTVVVSNWAQKDFPAALKYVDAMPSGEERDRNLATLIGSQVMPGNIQDRVYPLIESIEEQSVRDNMVLYLARHADREFPAQFNIVNSIDKAQLANTLQNLEGISEDTREQVNALLIPEPSED